MVAAGFLRIVTNSKAYAVPAPPAQAIAFLKSILDVPGVYMPELGSEWPTFEKMCVELDLRGNKGPDAWIAAAVVAGGFHLVTLDKGFARVLRRGQYTLLMHEPNLQEPRTWYAVRRWGFTPSELSSPYPTPYTLRIGARSPGAGADVAGGV